jgi:hypothetical protein
MRYSIRVRRDGPVPGPIDWDWRGSDCHVATAGTITSHLSFGPDCSEWLRSLLERLLARPRRSAVEAGPNTQLQALEWLYATVDAYSDIEVGFLEAKSSYIAVHRGLLALLHEVFAAIPAEMCVPDRCLTNQDLTHAQVRILHGRKRIENLMSMLDNNKLPRRACPECLTNEREEWAIMWVLGHELGHHVLGHLAAGPDAERVPQQELDADAFSGRLLLDCARRGGGDPEAAERNVRLALAIIEATIRTLHWATVRQGRTDKQHPPWTDRVTSWRERSCFTEECRAYSDSVQSVLSDLLPDIQVRHAE